FRGEIGYRLAEDVTLKRRARFEDLPYLFGCERRNDRAAIRDDGDETFGGEMAESFANGDAAGLKFAGDVVLAKLLALVKTPSEDLFTQAFGDSGGQRLPRNWIRAAEIALRFGLWPAGQQRPRGLSMMARHEFSVSTSCQRDSQVRGGNIDTRPRGGFRPVVPQSITPGLVCTCHQPCEKGRAD